MESIRTSKIKLHPKFNLPVLQVCLPEIQEQAHQALLGALNTTDNTINNLGESEKDILRLNYRLRYIGFAHLRCMERHNKMKVKNNKAVDNFDKVVCAICQFGNYSNFPDGAVKTKTREERNMEINKRELLPDQRVSVDQYQLTVTGRIYSSRG